MQDKKRNQDDANSSASAHHEHEAEQQQEGQDELFDTNSLGYKLRHCSDKTWDRVNIVGGIVIGCLAAFILFLLPESDTLGPMRWALALAAALLLPRVLENVLQRSVYKGKLVLLATFGISFLVYGVVGFLGYIN